MKIVTLVPGPKPNTVHLPLPDPILQYLGWKEGDDISIEIRPYKGQESLLLTRAQPRGYE
jgi:hypothetical protein